jgi:hypothetical protein
MESHIAKKDLPKIKRAEKLRRKLLKVIEEHNKKTGENIQRVDMDFITGDFAYWEKYSREHFWYNERKIYSPHWIIQGY